MSLKQASTFILTLVSIASVSLAQADMDMCPGTNLPNSSISKWEWDGNAAALPKGWYFGGSLSSGDYNNKKKVIHVFQTAVINAYDNISNPSVRCIYKRNDGKNIWLSKPGNFIGQSQFWSVDPAAEQACKGGNKQIKTTDCLFTAQG